MVNYTLPHNQIFICMDDSGYICKIKAKNPLEKQEMYYAYPFVLQIGFKGKDSVKIRFKGGSERCLYPEYLSSLKMGERTYFSREKIETIWLE